MELETKICTTLLMCIRYFTVWRCLLSQTLFLLFKRAKHFSNSLIIHEEETKEISTVKEVWKCHLNHYKIL